MATRRRAFVVAGSPVARKPVGVMPRPGDFVVAADLGARHALEWDWPVHLLVGDLDSLPAELVQSLAATGLGTLRAPVAKDQTDTELALASALRRQPEEVIICGALGGRTDHLLANVMLLTHPTLANLSARLVDGPETVRVLLAKDEPSELEVDGDPGDLVSLLPLGGDAQGVTTRGLLYPLDAETLFLGEARGVSNLMAGHHAAVSLAVGRLLVIHNRIGK